MYGDPFAPPPSRGWNRETQATNGYGPNGLEGGDPNGPLYNGPAGFAPYGRRSQGLGYGPGGGGPMGPGGPMQGGPVRVAQYITEGEDDGTQFMASDYGPLPHQFPMSTESGGERLTVFVNNIATNLHDFWVERILSCGGPMLRLNRVKDTAGKPRAFGFAEFGDFDTVLRCLEVIQGIPLKGEDQKEKALGVKADEKTQKRLAEYERTRARTDQDDEHLNFARNNVQHVLAEMKEPSATLFQAGGGPIRRRRIVAHLQDLEPEDLPPESRGMITNEIASFRNLAFKKNPEREARQRAEAEASAYRGPPSGPRGPGGPPPPQTMNGPPPGGFGQQRGPPPTQQHNGPPAMGFVRESDRPRNSFGPPGGQQFPPQQQQQQFPPQQQQFQQQHQQPPQQQQPVEPPDEGVDDEATYLRQIEAKRREAEKSFRERERQWEAHERQRESALRHDADRDRREEADEKRQAASMADKYATWDDDREAERGRETFYSDRPRWRTSRRAVRQRELNADRADAELEAKQAAESNSSSDAFLSSLVGGPKAVTSSAVAASSRDGGTGVSIDDSTPIKLSLVVPAAAAAPAAAIQLPKLTRPATAFVGADEDDEAEGKRKKRELIPLTYDDIDPEAGMTEEEKLERRKQMVKELVNSIPTDKESLWTYPIAFDYMTEDIIEQKLASFVSKKTVEALGFEEPEIVRAVIDHVRAKKSAAELAEELSPVMEDETDEFVIKCWRFVIYECLASQQGILTTV